MILQTYLSAAGIHWGEGRIKDWRVGELLGRLPGVDSKEGIWSTSSELSLLLTYSKRWTAVGHLGTDAVRLEDGRRACGISLRLVVCSQQNMKPFHLLRVRMAKRSWRSEERGEE